MARQWHATDSTMITMVMPYGGTDLPTCANVIRAGDGNRTRTISLGIRQIQASDHHDLGIQRTASNRHRPSGTGVNGKAR
jgi:hypothetical protein